MPKPKILVVDDEDNLRKLVMATLESPRYDLLQASDGKQALQIASAERPELVLLDVAMPEMDGYDVCRELKASPATKDCVVVLLTAMGQPSDRQKGLDAGADDYFTKPFSPIALLGKVSQVMGARSRRETA